MLLSGTAGLNLSLLPYGRSFRRAESGARRAYLALPAAARTSPSSCSSLDQFEAFRVMDWLTKAATSSPLTKGFCRATLNGTPFEGQSAVLSPVT